MLARVKVISMEVDMKKLIVLLVACAIPAAPAFACSAFFQYEQISGMNKICTYDHLGSAYAMTIKSYQICPVTIKVAH